MAGGEATEAPLSIPTMERRPLEGEEMASYRCGDIAASILLEKRVRKQVEDDTLRLYNRVRQLVKEEEKAQKRIEDTQRKTEDILELRERNELRNAERGERIKEVQETVQKQREDNLRLKQESKEAKCAKQIRVLESKQSKVQQTKEERATIERLVAEDKLLARRKALEQKEAVRKAQKRAEHKIQRQRTAKLQSAQEEYERRLREEMDVRILKEKELTKLVRIELDLIERLKEKQAEQRAAYEQLEAALSLGRQAAALMRIKSADKIMRTQERLPKAEEELTDEEITCVFAQYDPDGTGYIQTSNVEKLVLQLGISLNSPQVKIAIAQLDPDETGRVSFGEFLLWWKG